MKAMSRIIWIFIIVAIGAYFINNYLQSKAKEKAEQEKAKRIEQSIRATVYQMVSKFNAIDDWEEKLSKGKRFRTEKILTIELEKLWLNNRPILFVGSIEDIATLDKENYILRIERSLFTSLKYIFNTELALELKCNKSMVDSFFKKYPNLFSDYDFNIGVAVIAKINQIKTEFFINEEGVKEEIKIGEGRCLALAYTGRVAF